ncbi:hypothetical protein [Paraburkholderia panacisoli]|uniref:hypothetical protein n=1 Tax=Paraburkholderia panacisoli TaxID=2603818 RepID=UPI00165F1E1F|nr:hypothetical protein [Paraburkholderia panacisoli]
MNIALPPIPDALLLELSAVIATLEVIRKVKGPDLITGEFDELGSEAAKLLAMFDAGSL